ncbi:stealth conserved region 3 domain-containing protein [Shimia thalassica]|uniref:stealth conserved region 3 domain-containing protein n=1 Tax=Shimia thalassica TaxID=1715693 RepID=UPI002494C8B8|nr:stealth conserved region 3 domain-containing protein [Shimia thalassica]
MSVPAEPIDVVYTWVDDSFPGYMGQLNAYADDPRDTDPNRTRDNLDILRFSLRSVWQNLPQIRNIHILSMRPQVPPWLDTSHPKIHVTHHDEIMSASILPTFNSFSIVSHLHLLPDLSSRFLYFEDDMLALSPDLLNAFFDTDGVPLLHLDTRKIVPQNRLNPSTESPWNLALANMDTLLSDRFGPAPRRHITHGPHLLEKDICAQMCRDFAEHIDITRKSRFRTGDNVPPEVLACFLAVENGAAKIAPDRLSQKVQGYVSIDNFLPWTWFNLRRMDRRQPLSATLNDNFQSAPNPRVEKMVRTWMMRRFLVAAPWERTPISDTPNSPPQPRPQP